MDLNIYRKKTSVGRRTKVWFFILGILVCIIILLGGKKAMTLTSTDKYCMSCHIHPGADQSWKLSTHYNNKSGNIVHCFECHLPPEGHGYLFAKAKHGIKDAYDFYFKDSTKINWGKKKLLENARGFVYEKSCLECHQNLFPVTLSVNGGNAHLFYTTSKDPLNCINCHLNIGHYDRNAALHAQDTSFGVAITSTEQPFAEPAKVERFENYSEMIPGTQVSFDMVAVPGGTFNMGSPDGEPLRDPDEGPVRKVTLSGFWIAKTEVTWDEYLAFFRATSSQGRAEGKVVTNKNTDAISGATPPWGAPDQGWGKGSRPAITMTWHAANVYCQWLSKVTGKKYRLPTEAEWEYACRGGTETPYFFEGDPKKLSSVGFLKKLFRPDTTNITSRVVYNLNSASKTEEPSFVKSNPLGLKNMPGNVFEFCSDFYSAEFYKTDSTLINPEGPAKGLEHIIRGGSFRSDAKDVRSAARDFTKTQAWLVTDPQMPKSIWWYSDCIDVGFRVVCEPDTSLSK
jgi:formylglycine-generating enzyme required for sulfatase activity/nitrate/TMAO reductase-like tetraheme cytochrome c subunit